MRTFPQNLGRRNGGGALYNAGLVVRWDSEPAHVQAVCGPYGKSRLVPACLLIAGRGK